MEKKTYTSLLYDVYTNMFSDRQRQYFEEYYYNDYTLAEIAENLGVSRTAVHKALRLIERKLNDYESKLKLYEKRKKINKLLEKVDDEELVKKIKDVL